MSASIPISLQVLFGVVGILGTIATVASLHHTDSLGCVLIRRWTSHRSSGIHTHEPRRLMPLTKLQMISTMTSSQTPFTTMTNLIISPRTHLSVERPPCPVPPPIQVAILRSQQVMAVSKINTCRGKIIWFKTLYCQEMFLIRPEEAHTTQCEFVRLQVCLHDGEVACK